MRRVSKELIVIFEGIATHVEALTAFIEPHKGAVDKIIDNLLDSGHSPDEVVDIIINSVVDSDLLDSIPVEILQSAFDQVPWDKFPEPYKERVQNVLTAHIKERLEDSGLVLASYMEDINA